MELLSINSTLGERIRFYRQQAGLIQKGLADLCGVSESAIRNYELGNRVPDFLTLHEIAGKLRVNYAAISGEKVTELEGALQALYKLEEIYGLYPTEVDGHIHFVFRDGVAVKDFKPDLDFILSSPGTLLQYRVLGFMKACALHNDGKLTDEEYALWKSKFPAFMDDFREFWKRAGKEDEENFEEDIPRPSAGTEAPGAEPGAKNQQRAVAGSGRIAAQPDQSRGPRASPAKRVAWGEDEQRSGEPCRLRRGEGYGICEDEVCSKGLGCYPNE